MNLEPGVRRRDVSLGAPEPGNGIRRLRAQALSGETGRNCSERRGLASKELQDAGLRFETVGLAQASRRIQAGWDVKFSAICRYMN